MHRVAVIVSLMSVLLWPAADKCRADVDIGLSIGDDGIKGFYLAIGEHYRVPEKEIVVVRERNIPDEELPVVFFLAQRAKATPEVIIKLRLGGMSWMEICTRFGFTAEIFYIPIQRAPGPPFGKAYGHFKKKKRNEWGTIHLSDPDIVNFVNLRFISEHYGYAPDDVIKMRENGKGFVTINAEVKKKKKEAGQQSQKLAADEKSKSQGKNKDKEKKK